MQAAIKSTARSDSFNGIQSTMLLSSANVEGITSCLGVAVIPADSPATEELSHLCDEVMYVSRGEGVLVTPGGEMSFAEGDAIFIPAELPHALRNTGDIDLVSVYSFPTPERP